MLDPSLTDEELVRMELTVKNGGTLDVSDIRSLLDDLYHKRAALSKRTWYHALGTWMAKSPFASFVRSFIATVAALMLADWTSAASISFSKWESWLVAGLAAAIPVMLRSLNPNDQAFGAGSEQPKTST